MSLLPDWVSGALSAFTEGAKVLGAALGLVKQNKDEQAGAAMQQVETTKENQDVTARELKAAIDGSRDVADVQQRLRDGSF